jgi:hypothetical protein
MHSRVIECHFRDIAADKIRKFLEKLLWRCSGCRFSGIKDMPENTERVHICTLPMSKQFNQQFY